MEPIELAGATVSRATLNNTQDIERYINFWQEKSNCVNIEKNDDIQELEQIDVETSKIEFFIMGLRKLSGITTKEYINIIYVNTDAEVSNVYVDYYSYSSGISNNGLYFVEVSDETSSFFWRVNDF